MVSRVTNVAMHIVFKYMEEYLFRQGAGVSLRTVNGVWFAIKYDYEEEYL